MTIVLPEVETLILFNMCVNSQPFHYVSTINGNQREGYNVNCEGNIDIKTSAKETNKTYLCLLPILFSVLLPRCCHVLFTPFISAPDLQYIVFFGLPTFFFWLENSKLRLYSSCSSMISTHSPSSNAIMYNF